MKIYIGLLAATFLLLFGMTQTAQATHIRAGEITVERVNCNSLEFLITVKGYRDTDGDPEFGTGEIDFGDGTSVALMAGAEFSSVTSIDDKIEEVIFRIRHTYGAPNANGYTIGYIEANRNAGILNMNNSVETRFYIETKVIIDPFLGCNDTPVLLIPPIDNACVGAFFIHNPGAFDADGDSLAYKFVTPKQDVDREVDNYRDLNNPEFGGATQDTGLPATLTIDPITGDLVWDAPGLAGEYNVAFIIEEWRQINGQYFQLGYVTRDMQIIVEDCENERPELDVPEDTCVVAGTFLEAVIGGDDPDGHDVKIESFGGVYELVSSPATFSPDPAVFQATRPEPSPAKLDFMWQTNCTHVQERPYQVRFKITDAPEMGPALVDFKTWNVTVVGPPPEGLTAEVQPGRRMLLNWDDYTCSNAQTMQIWRRVDSYDFTPGHCETGIPENAGYVLAGEVPIGTTTFLDDNNGEGLTVGSLFCYRLVAVFPQPSGGESIVSEEACAVTLVDVPAITNVSVTSTGTDDGEVFVRWTSPFEIDETLFPPPYTYELYRSEGFNGTSPNDLVVSTQDTIFNDTGLNTEDLIYNYKVVLLDDTQQIIDSSATASSVRLDIISETGALDLRWSAEVPWSNFAQDFPYHYIYRDNGEGSALALIDSVNVFETGFRYFDEGQFDGVPLSDQKEYCYFVTTQGSYGNDKIIEPLLNNSQIICATPNDTIPPCLPLEFGLDVQSEQDCRDFLADKSCGFNDFANRLTWTRDIDPECQDDIRSFNIYFSPTGEDGTFEIVGNVTTTFFEHTGLTSFAGCYKVSAVDRSGNESALSETICNDNCPDYRLPNIFTPNGDEKNQTFRPFDCPRFVESVEFTVYNRWGREIFTYDSTEPENSIFINWDGKANNGNEVSTGVYFYSAKVKFIRLNPEDSETIIKGWVQVLR